MALVGEDKRNGLLAFARFWHTNDCSFLHPGELIENLFDFTRVNVDSVDQQHVFLTIGDVKELIDIRIADVSCQQPAVANCFGCFFGLILLIIPGFVVAARWSLLAPLVVLEERTVREARDRSSSLVKGKTETVLVCVVLTFILTDSFFLALLFWHTGFGLRVLLSFAWSSLTAPFAAHVLTVLYYRLADATRPVIDPEVLKWRSVWEGR